MHLNREKTISYRSGATPSPRWLVFSRDNEIIKGIRETRHEFAAKYGDDIRKLALAADRLARDLGFKLSNVNLNPTLANL